MGFLSVLACAISVYIFTNSLPSKPLNSESQKFVGVHPSQKLQVSFLDIGQGDAILIQAPNGNSLLVDSGPTGGKALAEIARLKSFFDRKIDAILITHGDADHIGSMIDVMKKYSVGTFFYSGIPADTKLYKNVVDSANNLSGINGAYKKLLLMSGIEIVLDENAGVKFKVLFPDFSFQLDAYDQCVKNIVAKVGNKTATKSSNKKTTQKTTAKLELKALTPKINTRSCNKILKLETNQNSIVGILTYGNTEFVLTGDAPVEVEKFLIDKFMYDKDRASFEYAVTTNTLKVLKLGHHGSKTSTSLEFLKTVNPRFAIISSGKNNRYGHPHAEVIQRLESFSELNGSSTVPFRILRTDEIGTITLESDGRRIFQK